jgi:hypothetical protein
LHLKLTSKYLWKPVKCILVASLIFLSTPASWAQQEQPQDACTSTDLWMLGSDFVRPGLAAKANYKIGIGHTFGFLKKDPIGDELTFGYTYEDAGSGFWHSQFGSHTESVGAMKNFGLPKTKLVTGLPGFNRALRVLPETLPCRTISITVSLWRNCPLQCTQFYLDSRELQQGGLGTVVHDHKRWIYVELVILRCPLDSSSRRRVWLLGIGCEPGEVGKGTRQLN